ncbi:DUF7738 domain-containing protein [Haloflavibacter putidus]|uniref:DUF7738 domain-containing protein n=1 Tax=Haloflavibacter putidus TaxID=2576776 RepID=A0A507ZFN1_9FLAO|nr:hypothetical protein [Haloflavibacter putidus]TQD36290.1 hypothetical protein FKR84_10790 [Haloflavibacter putidus]
MGIFDFRDPNKRKKKKSTIKIHCDPQSVLVNNTEVQFPTTYKHLKDILGDPDRIEAIRNSKNKVYLWDELGIYCSAPDPEKMLMLLLVEDNRYGLGQQPKKNFMGKVFIDEKPIEDNLQNVGEDRPYMIRAIIKDDKRVAIALGWNPGV